jgi:hypothetical protein
MTLTALNKRDTLRQQGSEARIALWVWMGPKTPVAKGNFFRHALRGQINLEHSLTALVNWDRLSAAPRPIGKPAAFDRGAAVLAVTKPLRRPRPDFIGESKRIVQSRLFS